MAASVWMRWWMVSGCPFEQSSLTWMSRPLPLTTPAVTLLV